MFKMGEGGWRELTYTKTILQKIFLFEKLEWPIDAYTQAQNQLAEDALCLWFKRTKIKGKQ